MLFRSCGIAQDLFFVSKKSAELFDGPNRDDRTLFSMNGMGEVCVYNLTEREHRILATVVQWFGSNCGFSFLRECLRECGYTLEPIRPRESPEKLNRTGRYKILLGQSIEVERKDCPVAVVEYDKLPDYSSLFA